MPHPGQAFFRVARLLGVLALGWIVIAATISLGAAILFDGLLALPGNLGEILVLVALFAVAGVFVWESWHRDQ